MGMSISKLLSGLFGKKEMRKYLDTTLAHDTSDPQGLPSATGAAFLEAKPWSVEQPKRSPTQRPAAARGGMARSAAISFDRFVIRPSHKDA